MGANNTGTVWDSIKRVDTYGNYPGTVLPEAYITTIEGKQLFVAPNAIKHLLEDLNKSIPSRNVDIGGAVEPWQRPITGEYFNQLPDPLRTQTVMKNMHEGAADIIRSNKIEFGKRYLRQDGWEIIFAPPGSRDYRYYRSNIGCSIAKLFTEWGALSLFSTRQRGLSLLGVLPKVYSTVHDTNNLRSPSVLLNAQSLVAHLLAGQKVNL